MLDDDESVLKTSENGKEKTDSGKDVKAETDNKVGYNRGDQDVNVVKAF